jgi:hypothetical protein
MARFSDLSRRPDDVSLEAKSTRRERLASGLPNTKDDPEGLMLTYIKNRFGAAC